MQTTIDYQKYDNMSKKSLFNALLSAEKKYDTMRENLEKKIKAQRELVSFLREKITLSINEKKSNLDIAIEQFNNGDVYKYNSYDEYEKDMNNEV
ncbi:hypothetical protein LMG7974_01570 [Campylobacter majalis]|uniref:Uncharacterized protein n=1 Tax=Campylobacter majalis TaxID=2790656 RepID=A0ABN7KC61_9BACT|nr:hypothetical protein [Campylobacter majalis]CAD7289493.1 hypothetical protein LMG7974_01570 [Campylobacter majalis]